MDLDGDDGVGQPAHARAGRDEHGGTQLTGVEVSVEPVGGDHQLLTVEATDTQRHAGHTVGQRRDHPQHPLVDHAW